MVYDNVPGGAGHVGELLKMGSAWLDEALKLMWHNESHHENCETACVDCILSADAWDEDKVQKLQRRRTWEFLNSLANGGGGAASSDGPAPPSIDGPTLSKEARKARLGAPKRSRA